tara:strand:- start:697 stop:834 length:138 start_codon:yes stop_codon:yes gene_type:complete
MKNKNIIYLIRLSHVGFPLFLDLNLEFKVIRIVETFIVSHIGYIK